jgi:rubrerythrin
MKTKLLDYLKKDEKKAPVDYRKLKESVHLKSSKKAISGIIRDEQRHRRILKKIEVKEGRR